MTLWFGKSLKPQTQLRCSSPMGFGLIRSDRPDLGSVGGESRVVTGPRDNTGILFASSLLHPGPAFGCCQESIKVRLKLADLSSALTPRPPRSSSHSEAAVPPQFPEISSRNQDLMEPGWCPVAGSRSGSVKRRRDKHSCGETIAPHERTCAAALNAAQAGTPRGPAPPLRLVFVVVVFHCFILLSPTFLIISLLF